jgi:DNA-binding GntR family transcriptional regulator
VTTWSAEDRAAAAGHVAADLRLQILSGQLAPGSVLPSPAELSRTYALPVRVIRHALEELTRQSHLIQSKDGWIVADPPAVSRRGRRPVERRPAHFRIMIQYRPGAPRP